ncbi:MAG TPA: Uma2 family endonuclease [Pyrinomonadaceae bacterium]|jgi:Uma2 family endonuclease|nr:Uma2 family endonuclease [Pyrinomonadaceae bacterium]
MAAHLERRYTLEEYLELDRTAEERFEFWQGEVFCMSGVSQEHAEIEINLTVALRTRLSGRKCRIFPANMRVKVPTPPPYRYADLSALCGEAQFETIGGVDALTNPALLVEVLSPSTESYDRGEKFARYKSIPGLREYLLVAQDRPFVIQLVKRADGEWLYRDFDALESLVRLESLDCEITLSEMYQNVGFAAPTGSAA